MHRFRVVTKNSTYTVVVGGGAWRALRPLFREGYSRAFVLTERGLWRRWRQMFLKESGGQGLRPLFLPAGEKSKSLAAVERLAGELLKAGADRRSLLIAFGGGVVGDVGGFTASTYMRGIDLVQVPTTVVAQVDSSIGGKTGVNVGAMKNLVGTFYPPRLVAAEPEVLSSMGARAFRSGLYEVVKHGILAGERFFGQLENHLATLRPGTAARMESILARAARVKVDVVSRDEREAHWRMVLNLGHTFGHALEEATAYRNLLHGEAVGWGLLGVIRLGVLLGLTPTGQAQRMAALVRRVGPLPAIRSVSVAQVVRLLPQDKKTIGGKIHWVIPERIGKIRITTDVPRGLVTQAFRELQRETFP